jgi:NTE family protein
LKPETVLVLQGGGSLGAYECGVYKCLYKHGIKFDVLAGSSIGAINASIIAAIQNTNKEDPSATLENFWLSLAEDIIKLASPPFLSLSFLLSDKMVAIVSSMYSAFYGNPKSFIPKWFMCSSQDYYLPYKWTYLYDPTPLKETLKQYIDFDKLKKMSTEINHNDRNNKEYSRLIITSTDIQKGEPVIFDNAYMDIDVDKVIACIGYPFYGIRWSNKDGRYLWDGSLLTNTPMLEVIRASTRRDKKFYIVDVFPRRQQELPENMIEVWHRARDIIFMDKTDNNIEMLKENERYVSLLRKMYNIINAENAQVDKKTKARLEEEIEPAYDMLVRRTSRSIKEVIRIGRIEKLHYLLEDADFSLYRIKKLISEGEKDAASVLAKKDVKNV